jgi:carboxypeptidase PM20D1
MPSLLRRAALALLALLLVLVAVVLLRAVPRAEREPVEAPAPLEMDREGAIARFAEGLRFRTVSHPEDSPLELDQEAFLGFRRHLERSYPLVHRTLHREIVSGHSLLYTWPGTNPSLPALLLLGHQDVVPVEPGSEGDWTHPPYAGRVVDGELWGRGAIDDKASVFGILEASEALLREGFRPRRTLHLAFGHDEELGGPEGARAIARLLEERGVRAWMVLDEGGGIASGVFPGADFPIAAIAVAEKGYVSATLVAHTEGGHSSTPSGASSIGLVARAVAALEASPMPARFEGPVRELFDHVGPHMSFSWRALTRNLWLFAPAVERVMLGIPAAAAALRTTTAPTIFHAGVKDNVLPSRAEAVVNFRILPGDTIESVMAHVERTVGDERVEIGMREKRRNPPPISPTDSEAWDVLTRTVREIFPDAVAGPFLALGGTDARHYTGICENVYRFLPMRLGAEAVKVIHGTNERIGVDAYLEGVRFYAQLIRNATG